MKCIIPAAGFGTRMSMAMDKSKEMLKDPGYKHQPIIQYSLDLCEAFNLEPVVITREEKKDLRQYLFDNQVETLVITPEGEWNNTVLKSSPCWEENNILILPDTRFYSFKVIEDIQRGLMLGNNAVMALHEVIDPSKWGMVEDYVLYEKSPTPLAYLGKQWAWGLIGFKDSYGQELFSQLQYRSGLKLRNVGFTYLDKFEDITRNGK